MATPLKQPDLPKGMPTLRGDQFRRTLSASVFGVLGKDARPVSSRGTRFYNRDRWTGRQFTFQMCKWASANPGCVPTRADIATWVADANATKVPRPEIVIAAVPDRLPLRVAMALTGGVYHEAFHTLFSCRRDLAIDEVAKIVLPRWAKVPDWSKLHKALQHWTNLVEDIRIERRGREVFPGAETKLHDLQDFIIDQESKGLEGLRTHEDTTKTKAKKPKKAQGMSALSVIAATFRDVGLGYVTTTGKIALERYRQANAEAVDLVLDGPLSPLLREAIILSSEDDLGCLRVGMDVLVFLAEDQKDKEPDEGDESEDAGDEGEGKPPTCPGCDAPPWKLVVRPKSDGKGGKIQGKGICTCTVCGWQLEVDIKDKPAKSDKKGPALPGPRFEGFDPSDADDAQSADGTDDADPKDGKPTKATPKGTKSAAPKPGPDKDQAEEGTDPEANGQDDKTTKAEGQDDSEAEGQDDSEAEGTESDDGESEDEAAPVDLGGLDGLGEGTGSDSDGSEIAAGGFSEGSLEHAGHDWTQILATLETEAAQGAPEGLLDGSAVLEAAIGRLDDIEDQDVDSGEKVWRPWDPANDQIRVVAPSARGREHDAAQAGALLDSVKSETSFLRARLRTIVRAMEMVQDMHGIRRGRDLSERFLVDSKIALKNGQMPERAFYARDTAIDTSMAAAIVVDQSYSMIEGTKLRDATRVMCALAEPLDALGCKVQASGFRDGARRTSNPEANEEVGRFHRIDGIIHDVFKTFDERFAAVKWRFANTRAEGGTPMSDGIQFGLDALSGRKEGHRILFVITDGDPNWDHRPTIARQLRLAKEAGIHVVGVGLGLESRGVQTLFPDHVWTLNLQEMPKALVAKLNTLVADARMAARRGQQMARA